MPINYYPKLAFESIRKNKQLYIPYLITCILMVSIYYILSSLIESPAIKSIYGADIIITILSLGLWVIIFLAVLILFYSNSFLIRRRKKEFGLYSILGLSQLNIVYIQFFESLFIALTSLIVGIGLGILFSKLFEIGLLNTINGSINYDFTVSVNSIVLTIILFIGIFFLLFLNSIWQVNTTSINQLLRGESHGEKPPKSNWFVALLGLASLVTGYYIAVTIESPLEAFTSFFVAVLFVIFGTYLVLISGSVLFCRILQRNKKFYYKLNHFISVSSLVYRMKRNGAGLASICILSTTVLVILCTTVCLFIGSEDALNLRYPKDENLRINFKSVENLSKDNLNQVKHYIDNLVHEYKTPVLEPFSYAETSFLAVEDGSNIDFNSKVFEEMTVNESNNILTVTLVGLDEYNQLTNQSKTLNQDEVLIHNLRSNFKSKTITINGIQSFKVKEIVTDMFNSVDQYANMMPTITIIVPNLIKTTLSLNLVQSENTNFSYNYSFNVNFNSERQVKFNKEINKALDNSNFRSQTGIIYSIGESKEENRQSFLMLYGGLYYLGLILSVIFIFTTVIIMYFKQISEGFEDQKRFEMMQKIGLTKSEIKKIINSQMLTVFFIPLILAVLNLMFAFPVIQKLLLIFNFNNNFLFLLTTLGCIFIFSCFYVLVYKITSNEYYKIVS